MTMQYLFTSESVSEGHPDKLADTISDAVLDYVLTHQSLAHVACEVLITGGLVVVAGEIEWESSDRPALEKAVAHIVEATLVDVGYDPANFQVQIQLARQSPEISQGVRQPDGIIGAGDQGLMFGYATNETATLMPLPLTLAHALMGKQAELRHCGALPWLRPDAKAQVSVLYDAGKPLCVETVVLSTQHSPDIDTDTLRSLVSQQIIESVIPESLRSPRMRVLINPTGRFEIGGPEADTGLTGRKIIVDTYGGSCPHGGGAFSGKDPTKVDRSAAYMARYVAKNVVAAGLAERCTLQLAYAIGVADPVSVYVDLHGTGRVDERRLCSAIRATFDLTPAGIIKVLDLRRPIYRSTAVLGHFGREDQGFTWERTDRTAELISHCQ